jgi:hypothetical protein
MELLKLVLNAMRRRIGVLSDPPSHTQELDDKFDRSFPSQMSQVMLSIGVFGYMLTSVAESFRNGGAHRISTMTVRREWTIAKAWLRREMIKDSVPTKI